MKHLIINIFIMPLSSSQGMDLEEFPPLLSLGFSSPTVDNEEPLSFGTLLACLNMALSNLGPVSFVLYVCLLSGWLACMITPAHNTVSKTFFFSE